MKKINNPNRECNLCGSTDPNEKSKKFNEKTNEYFYSARCKKCTLDIKKKSLVNKCKKCGNNKEINYQVWCRNCSNEYQNKLKLNKPKKINAEILIEVKKFVRKMELMNFMADLEALNNVITYYKIISNGCCELDHRSSGEQLQIMWNELYRFYNDILKDYDDRLLPIATLVRNVRCGQSNIIVKKSDLWKVMDKKCNKCGEIKNKTEYYLSEKRWSLGICKSCALERIKKNKLIRNN
jgi:hypothetical protein